jgi:hypothetical protein
LGKIIYRQNDGSHLFGNRNDSASKSFCLFNPVLVAALPRQENEWPHRDAKRAEVFGDNPKRKNGRALPKTTPSAPALKNKWGCFQPAHIQDLRSLAELPLAPHPAPYDRSRHEKEA